MHEIIGQPARGPEDATPEAVTRVAKALRAKGRALLGADWGSVASDILAREAIAAMYATESPEF